MNSNKIKNGMKVKNVANFLANQYSRLWAHYVETADECYYLLNGEKLSTNEMDQRFPIPTLESNKIDKGKGLDSRTNFY